MKAKRIPEMFNEIGFHGSDQFRHFVVAADGKRYLLLGRHVLTATDFTHQAYNVGAEGYYDGSRLRLEYRRFDFESAGYSPNLGPRGPGIQVLRSWWQSVW